MSTHIVPFERVISIELAIRKLQNAIKSNRKRSTCLALWSKAIRLRDGEKCVLCHSNKKLSAHHIVRKSFMKELEFQTGNGITLCSNCHKEFHEGFNGKPDMNLPMDTQGGEKIEEMVALFGCLLEDAYERNLLNNEYYYISDTVLYKFKIFQGIPLNEPFPGPGLYQAYRIWNQCPRQMLCDILNALDEAESQQSDDETNIIVRQL